MRPLRYAIVIERAGSNCSALVPDLPCCVATGATVKEIERNLRDTLRLHLKGLKEDGLAIPKPTSICEYIEP